MCQGYSLLSVNISLASPQVVATFVSEQSGSMTAMAVDFSQSPAVAYAASQLSGQVYAVTVDSLGLQISSLGSIYTEYSSSSLIAAMTLAPPTAGSSSSTLYLTSGSVAYGVDNVVLSSLQVTGTAPVSGDSLPLLSTDSWDWPDSVSVSSDQSTVYVTDGGWDRGNVVTSPPFPIAKVYAIDISQVAAGGLAQVTLLVSSNALYLRGGMQLTPDQSTLVFAADTTLDEIVLFPQLVTTPIVAPPLSQSSSSSSSAAASLGFSSSSSSGGAGLPSPSSGSSSAAVGSAVYGLVATLFAPLTDVALGLSIAADASVVYVSSFYGNVYAIPLPVAAGASLPAPLLSAPSSILEVIQVDPTNSWLYLLDTKVSARPHTSSSSTLDADRQRTRAAEQLG